MAQLRAPAKCGFEGDTNEHSFKLKNHSIHFWTL